MSLPVRPTALALLLLAVLAAQPARAQPTTPCAEEYDQAQTAYFNAEFDRAIRLLQTCLQEVALSPDAQVRFYRLLAFAHIARNEDAAARTAIERLLVVDPAYTPNPDTDRPDYVALVRTVKAEQASAARPAEERDGRWLRWLIGGAGALAAGVAAAVLLGGGDDGSNELPTPPLPPSSN